MARNTKYAVLNTKLAVGLRAAHLEWFDERENFAISAGLDAKLAESLKQRTGAWDKRRF